MKTKISGNSASFAHLDMARGLAAILVLVAHLRQFVFYSYNELASRGPLEKMIWGVSGFGYQAVMIFFVLSGFFITRSIVLDEKVGRFAWKIYLIKRLTRLWVVLIPCLIATLLWDSVSISTRGAGFGNEDLGFFTLIKNALFLVQGATRPSANLSGYAGLLPLIAAPTYGSNGPLWSLTYEFWYYMIFPLLYFVISRPRSLFSALYFGAFIAGCAFVGEEIGLYGIIWLAGAVAYLVYDRGLNGAKLRSPLAVTAVAIALLAALVTSKLVHGNEYFLNLLVGLVAAPFVLVLANCGATSVWYRRTARFLADASYTVYLAHFPFLALLANLIVGNQRFPNSAEGYAVFVGIGAGVLIYCYGMYWLFERHTDEVRRYCLAKFTKPVVRPLVTDPAHVEFGRSQ